MFGARVSSIVWPSYDGTDGKEPRLPDAAVGRCNDGRISVGCRGDRFRLRWFRNSGEGLPGSARRFGFEFNQRKPETQPDPTRKRLRLGRLRGLAFMPRFAGWHPATGLRHAGGIQSPLCSSDHSSCGIVPRLRRHPVVGFALPRFHKPEDCGLVGHLPIRREWRHPCPQPKKAILAVAS